jgi:hypothetical protein
VDFIDEAINQGQATAIVDRIDTTAPQATLVMYSPATTTNGNVLATLLTDKIITKPDGRDGPATGTMFTKTYTDTTTETVHFTDLVGNAGQTGITIDRIDRTTINATLTYLPDLPTKENVVATIHFDKP